MRRDQIRRHLALFLIMILLVSNIMISSAQDIEEPADTKDAVEVVPTEVEGETDPEEKEIGEGVSEPIGDAEILPEENEAVEVTPEPVEAVETQPEADIVEEIVPESTITVSETPYTTIQEYIDVIVNKYWEGVPEGKEYTITLELYDANNPDVVIDTKEVTYTGEAMSTVVWEGLPLHAADGSVIDYAVREIDSIYFETSDPVVGFVDGELVIVEPQNSMYWNVEQASYILFRPTQATKELLIWTFEPITDQQAFIDRLYAEAVAMGEANSPIIADLINPAKPKIWISGTGVSYDFYPDDPNVGLVTIDLTWDGDYYMANLHLQSPNTWTHFAYAQSNKLIEITNTYNYVAEGSWTPIISKILTGRDMKAGEFSFELLLGDEVLQTATNMADGSVAFEPIIYDQTDIDQVYTYTIREVNGSLGGVTYDETIFTVEVTITDNGDGTLTATPVFDVEKPIFHNLYAAKGSWIPEVKKTLKGRDLKAGEFSFVLMVGEEVLQTKQNDAEGKVIFDEIVYTKEGVYEYTIVEVKGDLPNMVYDEVVHTIVVTVTDNEDGTLAVKPDYDVPLGFVNKYIEKIDITATKKWVGGPKDKPIIHLQLYRNGEKFGAVVELDGVTTYTWKDLLKYDDNGKAYVYTVKEPVVPNYWKATYSEDGLTVTNTYTKEELPSTGVGSNVGLLFTGLSSLMASLYLGRKKQK